MIYIGIGATQEQVLPSALLRRSILEYSSLPIKFIDISENIQHINSDDKIQRTPFSFQRFRLAEICLNQKDFNIGLYLDSDMLVFDDVHKLIDSFTSSNYDLATVNVGINTIRRHQSSVLLFNKFGAELLMNNFSSFIQGKETYDEIFYMNKLDGWAKLDPKWNCLEYFNGRTSLIHFTDMDYQPWISRKNPLRGIWECYLRDAVLTDKEFLELLISEISRGNVRPSLSILKDKYIYSSYIPVNLILKDLLWTPSHRMKNLKKLTSNKLIIKITYIIMNIYKSISNKNGLINRI